MGIPRKRHHNADIVIARPTGNAALRMRALTPVACAVVGIGLSYILARGDEFFQLLEFGLGAALFVAVAFWIRSLQKSASGMARAIAALNVPSEREDHFTDHATSAAGTRRWSFDRATDVFLVSATVKPKLDRDEFEFRGRLKQWLARVHPADRADVQEAYGVRSPKGDLGSIEYRVINAHGEVFWFHDRVDDIGNSDAPDGVLTGTLTDITSQRQIAFALNQSRELLQQTEEIARIGGWSWLIEEDRLFWTEQVYRIHEVPLSYRPRVETAIDFYPPGSREQIVAALETSRRTGKPYDLEVPFVTAGGRSIWVRAMGKPRYHHGRIVGIDGTFQDITEKKNIEIALRESEERYKYAIEAVNDGVWDWNIPTGELVVNDNWLTMLGYDPGEIEVSAERCAKMIHPDDLPAVQVAMNRSLASTDGSFEARFRFVSKSGDWHWVLSRGKVVVRDEKSNPVRMVGTNKDIRVEMETVDQLKAACHSAESAARAKSEFLANMSHEIRTPMTAIIGFSENLLDDKCDDSERRNSAETIRRNGNHLLELINDILDLSRIEAGRMPIERLHCFPTELLNEVVTLLSVRAEAKKLRLLCEYRGNVPDRVETDPTRLRQILVNLIGNAIKFTEKGEVRVVCRLDKLDESSYLRFDVIDTGIGIDPRNVDRLFMPFAQADATMSRRFGGTGLGLVISRRLARSLGGDITVRSEPNQGSVFTVTISVGLVNEASSIDAGGRTPVPVNQDMLNDNANAPYRILVAEDGFDNRRLIGQILRLANATVVMVENGRDALDEIQRTEREGHPFDIVLMDMQMPVMDGYQATRHLRQIGCEIPIIALTAHTLAGDQERCMAAGCDGYQSKPIRRAELIQAIREHVERRSVPS